MRTAKKCPGFAGCTGYFVGFVVLRLIGINCGSAASEVHI